MTLDIKALDFDKSGGLVTIVTQDASSGAVFKVLHFWRSLFALQQARGPLCLRRRASKGMVPSASRQEGSGTRDAT